MLKKNDDIILELTDTLPNGCGVGRYDGMVVFVPGGIEGERIGVHIVKVLKSHCYGKLTEVIKPSPYRVEPKCSHFGKCGGCSLQHIDYATQLTIKSRHIKNCFKKQQLYTTPSLAIESPLTLHYRNKAQYPVGQNENGEIIVGMYAKHSHRLTEIDFCPLQPIEFEAICDAFCKYATQLKIPSYNEATHSGVLRHLYLRTNTEGEIMLTIVAHTEDSSLYKLCKLLSAEFKNIVSTYINVNSEKTNVILGKKNILVFGEPTISQSIIDIPLSISPDSFLQVNIPATRLLYSQVAESICPNENVLDMYCGAGSIGLSVASLRKNINLTGIEIVESAVKNANKTAKHYGINAKFICADATNGVDTLLSQNYKTSTVILDPPRRGCDLSVLNAVCKISPQRIIMISCNPATAARDCKYLTENNYTIDSITPVDMFPQTEHVESVVLLTKVHN